MSQPGLLSLSGSLRKESFSTAILKTLAAEIASQATVTLGDIGTLPLYNQDLDTDTPPPAVAAMRQALADSDGLVISTPEYNHGMSGVLKNAIDWLSRPPGKSALIGKPVFIVSSSPAFTGGVRAQPQLREALICALARPMIGSEIVIATAHTKIADGKLTDKASVDFAMKNLKQFIGEIEICAKVKAA